jgi:hypothetical protein
VSWDLKQTPGRKVAIGAETELVMVEGSDDIPDPSELRRF